MKSAMMIPCGVDSTNYQKLDMFVHKNELPDKIEINIFQRVRPQMRERL